MADDRNYLQVFHGPPCGTQWCTLSAGDVLVETWNRGLGSIQMEILTAECRVADPDDHAGSYRAWGLDAELAISRLNPELVPFALAEGWRDG